MAVRLVGLSFDGPPRLTVDWKKQRQIPIVFHFACSSCPREDKCLHNKEALRQLVWQLVWQLHDLSLIRSFFLCLCSSFKRNRPFQECLSHVTIIQFRKSFGISLYPHLDWMMMVLFLTVWQLISLCRFWMLLFAVLTVVGKTRKLCFIRLLPDG